MEVQSLAGDRPGIALVSAVPATCRQYGYRYDLILTMVSLLRTRYDFDLNTHNDR